MWSLYSFLVIKNLIILSENIMSKAVIKAMKNASIHTSNEIERAVLSSGAEKIFSCPKLSYSIKDVLFECSEKIN